MKAAMIKFMQTGEIQPCTGAGLNPIDKSIAKYPNIWTMGVCLTVIPIAIGCFMYVMNHLLSGRSMVVQKCLTFLLNLTIRSIQHPVP